MADPAAARPRLALVLAAIGGWVDAVGFLVLFGLFTAHLSGNTARLGVALGQGELATALTYAVPIVVFFTAVVAGAAYLTARPVSARRVAPLLAVEITLLTVFMVVGTVLRDSGDLTARSAGYYGLAVAAVAAMGLQNATLRHVSGVPVHTTFITGMVISFGEEVVRAARHEPDAPGRARLHGGLVAGYIAGAVCGSALESTWALWALSVPIAVLIAVLATSGRVRAT